MGDTCPVTQRATWRPALTRGGKMRFYILGANEVGTPFPAEQQTRFNYLVLNLIFIRYLDYHIIVVFVTKAPYKFVMCCVKIK